MMFRHTSRKSSGHLAIRTNWIDYVDFEDKIIIENNEIKHYQPSRINKTVTKERELKKYFLGYNIIITKYPKDKRI